MSDLHKSDPDSPYADDLEFVRDYARRNDGYSLVQPVVDFINSHLTPQIIRTVEELEALDPETPIWSRNAGYLDVAEFLNAIEYDIDYADDLPAVVVLPAEQVRAAREALEEA